MDGGLDFAGLGNVLLSRARELLVEWLPGGRLIGREFTCGSLQGESGGSLKVNVDTGKWSDFATGEKGGDLISLYAAINSINQVEAAKKLSNGAGVERFNSPKYTKPKQAPTKSQFKLGPPPEGVDSPDITGVSESWAYYSEAGELLFYVCRTDGDGEKSFFAYSWEMERKQWVRKSWPAPRPLFGLEQLANNPELPVLIVEGEKSAIAARKIVHGKYVVVTWPNGSNSFTKADWSPIFGRNILIWPDMDEPGVKAAAALAKRLAPQVQTVKVLAVEAPQTSDGEDPTGAVFGSGWDAADAVAQGWEWRDFSRWARPIARVVEPTREILPEEILPTETFHVEHNAVPEPSRDEETSHATSLAGGDGPPPLAEERVEDESLPALLDVDPDTCSRAILWERLGLAMSAAGVPINNVENVLLVLQGWPGFAELVWFDEFHQKFLTRWRGETVREWSDIDGLEFLVFMQSKIGMSRLTDAVVYQAIQIHASRSVRHEPRDWMSSLTWDGTPRVDTFFPRLFGVEEGIYSLAASKNWWLGMVARVFRPGCKVDNMVILEGSQGSFKSSALGIIGGRWYSEVHESVTSKDFYLVLQGKLVVEISELEAFSKAETNSIKKVITCQSDRFRQPYGKLAKDYPRQCIFVGTTNEDEYLRDATGARRFWPMRIGRIDLAGLHQERDQLFAEAVSRFHAGETWHDMPQIETNAEQNTRQTVDAWEDVIEDYLSAIDRPVKLSEIAMGPLKMEIGRVDRMHQLRIGYCLRRLGWQKKVCREGPKLFKGWVRSESLRFQ